MSTSNHIFTIDFIFSYKLHKQVYFFEKAHNYVLAFFYMQLINITDDIEKVMVKSERFQVFFKTALFHIHQKSKYFCIQEKYVINSIYYKINILTCSFGKNTTKAISNRRRGLCPPMKGLMSAIQKNMKMLMSAYVVFNEGEYVRLPLQTCSL